MAIDSTMTAIRADISGKRNVQYDKYMAKVALLVVQLGAAGPDRECALMARCREKMRDGTGIALGVREGLVLQRGLAEMLMRLATQPDSLQVVRVKARERERERERETFVWCYTCLLLFVR